MDRPLTDITDGGPNLNEFWVRSLGFSKEFSHIKMLDQLTPAERLLAAVLRSDRPVAREIITEQDRSPDLYDQFVNLVRIESFGCLVFERIVALDLASDLQSSDNPAAAAAFASIRMMSLFAAANHYQLEEKFAKVLDATHEYRSRTLWVKGAHLSRTVYEPSYFRHYGDLDVIVEPSVLEGFVESLRRVGFTSFHAPGYCNQIGVGPVNRPLDVITAPLSGWIPAGAVTMSRKEDGCFVDIKVGPFERGLQAVEFQRLFADAEDGCCLSKTYLAPSQPDHLLIMLCNFAKNRFKTWRTLFDIHMLAIALNKTPNMWKRFVEACKTESVTTTAWMSLSIAVDRLSTPIPGTVLASLAPNDKFFAPLLSFTVNPAYVWNSTSLPMMILNAFASADRKRKLDMLAQSFFPSPSFLSNYYGNREASTQIACLRFLPMHWFVLLMPGGLVRRTFGRIWWSSEQKF